ncbi:hypothetical protein FHP29_04980 [Nocardioides albidus]|uniref:Uncharacterized protein n=1 Tax=Nocardioides albidus TaxID=1517589 RepID=A0A5C4WAQ6_9ACTN|nr:hypothetical protein [Nocardioides albidus]TNM45162.1 hypothetical protein FHP29_04980 [Nocardioides albidus]
MNHELLEYVRRSQAAERSGDPHAALEWHRSVPMFRRNRHVWLLEQLSLVGEDSMPEWAWARWITYQAIRCESGDAGAIGRTLLELLVESVHQDLLQECFDRQGDPIKVVAAVAGESWVYHQTAAHASDMVEAFLHEFADGTLAEHADLARRWVGATMSGYQLLESRPGARLVVREAGTEATVELLDLGARSVAPDGWVIGRLVPSGIGDLSMFDMTPFAVDEPVAREVAATGNWLHPLTKPHRAGEVPSSALLREDYELVTDVAALDLVRFGTKPADLERTMDSLRGGRDEVTRASYRILSAAVAGDLPPEDQAYVAAAALGPRVHDDVRRKLVRSGHPEPWVTWAGRTPNPARARLLELAESARASA